MIMMMDYISVIITGKPLSLRGKVETETCDQYELFEHILIMYFLHH